MISTSIGNSLANDVVSKNKFTPSRNKETKYNNYTETTRRDDKKPIINISSKEDAQKIKILINQIKDTNISRGKLATAKQSSENLKDNLDNIQDKKDTKEYLSKANTHIKHILKTEFAGEKVFNKEILLQDKMKTTSIKIKNPPVESTEDIGMVYTDIENALKKISQIETILQSKVEKDVDSFDHEEAVEEKELQFKTLDNNINQTNLYTNFTNSEILQKEILWLLR